MKGHHQAHMTAAGDQMKSAMAGMMQDMDKHLTAVAEHLTALETEVRASAPNSAKVSEHTEEILKQCDGMSRMHAKAKTY